VSDIQVHVESWEEVRAGGTNLIYAQIPHKRGKKETKMCRFSAYVDVLVPPLSPSLRLSGSFGRFMTSISSSPQHRTSNKHQHPRRPRTPTTLHGKQPCSDASAPPTPRATQRRPCEEGVETSRRTHTHADTNRGDLGQS
jgi:hypothetical protein